MQARKYPFEQLIPIGLLLIAFTASAWATDIDSVPLLGAQGVSAQTAHGKIDAVDVAGGKVIIGDFGMTLSPDVQVTDTAGNRRSKSSLQKGMQVDYAYSDVTDANGFLIQRVLTQVKIR